MKMLEKIVNEKRKYVSCIKINGVPILPPVVTSAKRKELLKYKHQAIKLEKRLKRERELREYITRYYLPKLDNVNLLTESLEHQLSFFDENTLLPTPSDEISIKKQSKLCCDLQVSQYTNNEFKVITNFENNTSVIKNIIENEIETPPQIDSTSNLDEIMPNDEIGKPKLIRSDSYVLETPSPMLLEHLKRHNDESQLNNVPIKGLIASTPNEEGQDKLNLTKSDFCSETESELKNISDHSSHSTQGDITVLSKDITVDGDIEKTSFYEDHDKYDNENKECDEKFEENQINHWDFPLVKDLSLDQNDQEKLTNILNAIPESYSKQILELLEKQRMEQTVRLRSYTKLTEECLTIPAINKPLNYNPQSERSIYYTPDTFESPQIHGLSSKLSSNIQIINDHNKLTDSLPINIIDIEPKVVYTSSIIEGSKTLRGCNRKLFGDLNRDNYIKMNWAASVIQAHIRGYLTRRLLRSERVQGLIQTIKDALICAMELHSECADNINESDVELHRRLIQQVSAAVEAFHRVFFEITTSEKMSVIRIDRERLKEKLKRPRSKGSISGRTSRSSRHSRLS
ncbi:uncharacterized protein [Onthophagus taurus]|uniref:uncharacterized protein n=1 Tax=Onthophagus taurus TaxID=166361 RepID=UPI0039BE813B